jgi:spore germination protein YaaH
VSQIVLMAYDQHGPWEKTPGPVGATSWVTRGVRALESSVPAARVDLGVAGYGYVWGPGGRQQLSDAGARALVAKQGGHARWVASVGEWTATLPSGAVVWWSDTRTLALREALAARLGLHGLAVWSLGLSDPIS